MFKLPSPGNQWLSHKEYKEFYNNLKRDYPIRYFLLETVPWFFHRTIRRPIERVWDWIVYHTFRRHHMLDLRQVGGYRYGWCDTDTKMEYALFNLLDTFVKKEFPSLWCPSEEDIENATDQGEATVWRMQRENCLEIKAIHNYLTVGRLEDHKKYNELSDRWCVSQNTLGLDHPSTTDLSKQLAEADTRVEEKMTETLIRLIKIRGALWT